MSSSANWSRPQLIKQLPTSWPNPTHLPLYRIHLPGIMVFCPSYRFHRRIGSLYHGRCWIQGQVER